MDGLGYYARARNLHRTAVIIHQDLGGKFPDNQIAWAELPGVGPSTAAAITSICFNERVAILDGNVKRVLTRFLLNPAGLAPVVLRTSSGRKPNRYCQTLGSVITHKPSWILVRRLLTQATTRHRCPVSEACCSPHG